MALEAGEDIRVLHLTWPEALEMVRDGRIHDAKSVAGLLYYDTFRDEVRRAGSVRLAWINVRRAGISAMRAGGASRRLTSPARHGCRHYPRNSPVQIGLVHTSKAPSCS